MTGKVSYQAFRGLLEDLIAFTAEHRRCGMLHASVEGGWVRMRCDCGAQLVRRADED